MLAKMLCQIMKKRHLTQTELAKQIGVTRPSIGYWLKGSVPTGDNLEKLCKFLNVEPSFLQYGISSTEEDETTVTVPALDREPTPEANLTDGNRGFVAVRVSKEWLNSRCQTDPNSLRIFNMTGLSMVNGFSEGDILFVDSSINEIKATGVYVLQEAGKFAVRRIQYNAAEDSVTIIFDKPLYENIKNDNPETIDVLGKVIFAYKRMTEF